MGLERYDDIVTLRRRRLDGSTETIICGQERAQHYLLQGYVTDQEWILRKGRAKNGGSMQQFFKDLAGRSAANSDVLLTGAAIAFFLTYIF